MTQTMTYVFIATNNYSKQQWTIHNFKFITKSLSIETLKRNTYIYNLREQEIIDIVWFVEGISVKSAHPTSHASDGVDDKH